MQMFNLTFDPERHHYAFGRPAQPVANDRIGRSIAAPVNHEPATHPAPARPAAASPVEATDTGMTDPPPAARRWKITE